MQPFASSIYSPVYNTVYSAADGSINWSTPLSATGIGAVAGTHIVFQSGTRILVATP